MFGNHIALAIFLLCASSINSDWTTLNGNNQRTGCVDVELKSPFKVLWVRHFAKERLSTAVEPIVSDGKLFTTTHSGRVHALDAQTGQWLWSFQTNGPILHSPAFSDRIVVSASTDGYLYANNSDDGNLKWSFFLGQGGASASPMIDEGKVFIGSRRGDFFAIKLENGKMLWQKSFGVPIRQTASYFEGKVYFTTEDMIVRCLDAKNGYLLWSSDQLIGQTARDYYPVIAKFDDQIFVIIRTNPTINMARLIGLDRHIICQSAGVDDSSWQQLDEWSKNPKAIGNITLWAKEQDTIIRYLDENPASRTFFILDGKTGKQIKYAPILWAAGCQGCGVPPVVLPDGKLLVFYRSVYGNWNLGVAPFVSLGLLDLDRMRIEPLMHNHGMQPPWNTFWGTADETQHFIIAGKTLLIVHQGTLSGFDMETRKLFHISGNRDSWGGFRDLIWARNEWHGPARSGVAVVGNKIYWITGSRIICILSGENGKNATDIEINPQIVKSEIDQKDYDQKQNIMNYHFKDLLIKAINEFLSNKWAPYMLEPGLADRDFAFDDSSSVFSALSLAYPFLDKHLQDKVKAFLAGEWSSHPPYTTKSSYNFNEGLRREYWANSNYNIEVPSVSKPFHSFIGMYSVKLYAERCGEWSRVISSWNDLKDCFNDFVKSDWKLSADKGDLYANCYLASLIAFADIADKIGDKDISNQAKLMIEETKSNLISWWKRCSGSILLRTFKDISEWDKFIGEGDSLFFRIMPHRSKIALFHGLTQEVSKILLSKIPDEIDTVLNAFETLCPTWYLSGEERQVHYGENFTDLTDFGIDAFKAMVYLKSEQKDKLISYLDIPLCYADLNYITRLALILSSE
ncbi:MAG: PQQ-binding-like beta-propeller repeat protein [Candidatus Poribacteria bacterium]